MNRDEFAAAALTGLLAHHGLGVAGDGLIQRAYELADEMIRQQKPCADNFEIFVLACAVGDAFVTAMRVRDNIITNPDLEARTVKELHALVEKLELVTRSSAMRKVRP